MSRRSLVCVLIAQLLIIGSLGKVTALGQQSPGQSDRPLSERAQRALIELEEALAIARDFDDNELRVRVQLQAADMIWRVDEQRARQMFAIAAAATFLMPGPTRAGTPSTPRPL